MPHGTKIATCCYCGTRAALVLSGDTRHELSCSACGAPLHEMKALHLRPEESSTPVKHRHVSQPKTAQPPLSDLGHATKRPKKKKPKKRKTLTRRMFKEAFDLIEDILD